MRRMRPLWGSLTAAALALAPIVPVAASQPAEVSAGELLDLANQAEAAGDLGTAVGAYRALSEDGSVAVRSEARFRLARIYAAQGKLREAALLLRDVLDEQPMAQPVRLELVRVLDLMGDEAGARRTLREVRAGGLPPHVARFVDRYWTALRARKPFGGDLDVALAPDSNINRATRSETLGTVIGDFVIDDEARAKSGIGLALRGQAYGRVSLDDRSALVARVSGSADLYRQKRYNDQSLALTIGPEWRLAADRLSIDVGGHWRWYGGKPYSRAGTLAINHTRPLGTTTQLRSSATVSVSDNLGNSLQSGTTLGLSSSMEHALSQRAGVGFTIAGTRQALRDPGYSAWGAYGSLYGYREVGPATLIATVAYGRLWGDAPQPLFPLARRDRLLQTSLSATFRNLRIGSLAPFVRATYERNDSNVEIYAFRKLRTEFGVTRAF